MKGKLAAANITQIINELKKISSLNKKKKDKYNTSLTTHSNRKLYLLNRLLFTQKALSTKLSEQGLYTLNEFLHIYFTGVCSNVATRKS